MKIELSLLLVFGSIALGGHYYVTSDAVGGGSGAGYENNPWTLEESIRNAVAGDTIYLEAGVYDDLMEDIAVMHFSGKDYDLETIWTKEADQGEVIISSSTTNGIYIDSASSICNNITIKDINFQHGRNATYSSAVYLRATSNEIKNISFINCNLITSSLGRHCITFRPYSANITGVHIQNCNLVDNSQWSALNSAAGTGTLSFSMSDGSLTSASLSDAVVLVGAMDLVFFDRVKFLQTGNHPLYTVSVIETDRISSGKGLSVKDCTFMITGDRHRAFHAPFHWETINFVGNTISNTAAIGATAVTVGIDGVTNPNPYGVAYISRNSIMKTDTSHGHSLLIGCNYDTAVDPADSKSGSVAVVGNHISGGDLQIGCKYNKNSLIINNVAVGARPLALKACFGSQVRNNTFYATSGSAIQVYLDGSVISQRHIIENNICYTVGPYYTLRIDGNGSGRQIKCDHNAYFNEYNGLVLYVNQSGYSALNSLLTPVTEAWNRLMDTAFTDNDSHSLYCNPNFDPYFQTKNPILRNCGSPVLLRSDGMVMQSSDIGASKTQGNCLTPIDSCIAPPLMDSNGDCKVDFIDFCEFALEWMSCGFENQSDCFE